MREILFRGKITKDGEWLKGDYQHFTLDAGKIYPMICIWGEFSEGVIPETVEQYTGLEDKNGTKIFEGDIIAGALKWQERKENGLVAFRNGSFGLIWYRGEIEQFNPFTSMCNVEYEVIGNIHDNPELLKGGEGVNGLNKI